MSDTLEFCVYLYRDPRSGDPIYIGHGNPGRPWAHLDIAVRRRGSGSSPVFIDYLREQMEQGRYPEPIVLKRFSTRREATAEEARLIRHYGTIWDGTGTLLNLPRGGGKSQQRRQRGHIRANPLCTLRF
jgi:hypothetical protein